MKSYWATNTFKNVTVTALTLLIFVFCADSVWLTTTKTSVNTATAIICVADHYEDVGQHCHCYHLCG